MICLCCGKPLLENNSDFRYGWHYSCIKNFFGVTIPPDISFSEEVLEQFAIEITGKGLTVPGVQKKLSLHLHKGNRNERSRLTIVNYPTGYILKPQTVEYQFLPEYEHLVMTMAEIVGIKTVPHALVKMGDGSLGYITRRIDRNVISSSKVEMYAMEDFCQIEGRITADKYKGSYEMCAKIINKYSNQVGIDLSELFLRLVFSFVVGNSDMHLKNFSLIEKSPGSQNFVLSKAYDLLPVNVILPTDSEEFALTINGKKKNIIKKIIKCILPYGIVRLIQKNRKK